jgi:hypothetical protein
MPPASAISLQHVAADFETFFDSSEVIVEELHELLTQTLRRELAWLSHKSQAYTIGILLLLPHIQEVWFICLQLAKILPQHAVLPPPMGAAWKHIVSCCSGVCGEGNRTLLCRWRCMIKF